MQGILTIIVIGILAFIGFCIYFIFKILEFVIRSINLYEKILTREDVIIQLLIDIRDKNKSVNAADWSEIKEKQKALEGIKLSNCQLCKNAFPSADIEIYKGKTVCPDCYHLKTS